MKRILSFMLVAAMLLTMTACSGGTKPDPTVEPTTQPAETTAPAETTEPTVTEPDAQGVQFIDLMIGNDYTYEMTDDYILLASVSCQPLRLAGQSAEAYPALAAALEERNMVEKGDARENLEIMSEDARIMVEEMGAEFYGYTDTTVCLTQRADEHILSVREEYEVYNGMRPFWGTKGLNLDPATGERLHIDDILTDVSGLPQLIVDAMREKYDYLSEEEFESMEGWLEGYSPEGYTWTLSYQGVTFYFGVSELAAGAVGELFVTLWFDEHPGLFVEKYTEVPGSGYALSLVQYDMNDVDLHPGDGKQDQLFVHSMADDELIVGINGNNLYFTDYYAYSFEPYLVTCDNEHFYLYVDAAGDNDYRTIYIFDLSGDTPEFMTALSGISFGGYWAEDGVDEIWYRPVFNDPSHVTMASKIDLLGTRTGKRSYQINPSTGIPVAQTEYFNFSAYEGTMESLVELELLILPELTAEKIPAGTVFQVLRTNGSTYMDARLPDGRECRIMVDRYGWECMVNGMSEYECFDGVHYAG